MEGGGEGTAPQSGMSVAPKMGAAKRSSLANCGKNDSHQKLETQCKEQDAKRKNYRIFCPLQILFEIGPLKSASVPETGFSSFSKSTYGLPVTQAPDKFLA
jgi:hypothetical protein